MTERFPRWRFAWAVVAARFTRTTLQDPRQFVLAPSDVPEQWRRVQGLLFRPGVLGSHSAAGERARRARSLSYLVNYRSKEDWWLGAWSQAVPFVDADDAAVYVAQGLDNALPNPDGRVRLVHREDLTLPVLLGDDYRAVACETAHAGHPGVTGASFLAVWCRGNVGAALGLGGQAGTTSREWFLDLAQRQDRRMAQALDDHRARE